MSRLMIFATLLSAFVLLGCSGPETVMLHTSQGPLVGEISKRSIHNYKAIPYAQAPVGDRRFRAPGPAPSWDEPRDAREFSPICMQSTDATGDILNRLVDGHGVSGPKRFLIKQVGARLSPGEVSEDCLYLNVRTPDPNARLPVMVWIHGGGHQWGSGDFSIYQGDDLSTRGVVLVTINYRLNIFGYLAHPLLSAEHPDGISGNYGLLDQIAALQWVQDNIESFGGDPDRVTLFGESAGASSIAAIMASPLSEGLFHRAIGQSGESTRTLTYLRDETYGPSAEQIGEELLSKLPDGAPATVAQLRALSAQSLSDLAASSDFTGVLRPVADGKILPQSVAELFRDGRIQPVPSIFGYNADEAGIFYNGPEDALLYADITSGIESQQLAELEAGYGPMGREIARLYNIDGADNLHREGHDIMGDEFFGVSTRFILDNLDKRDLPVWAYTFTRVPPSDKQTIGAYHSAEMAFVFGTHEAILGVSDEDEELTDLMQSYWVSFAENGDPNAQGLPPWPLYDGQNWMELSANTGRTSAPVRNWRHEKLSALSSGLNIRLNQANSPKDDVADAEADERP